MLFRSTTKGLVGWVRVALQACLIRMAGTKRNNTRYCRGSPAPGADNTGVDPIRLPVDRSYMKQTKTVVRAFDGTRQEVIGEIEIEVQIGPCAFNVEFQVMDISPSYNYLIGRP